MNTSLIEKTEKFLKDTLCGSAYLQEHPDKLAYRLEHSYRVANIGRQIAEAEGFDVTATVIACLLHDIAYCEAMPTREQQLAHGRRSAEIARPFVAGLGLPEETAGDILCGIAIHVDGEAGFEWLTTPFAETVSDADNIDRFDAYRIYESLEYNRYSSLPIAEKSQHVNSTLERLHRLHKLPQATATADRLWQQRVDYYISFYDRLQAQLAASEGIDVTG